MLIGIILLLQFFLTPVTAKEPGIFYNPPTGGPIHEYQDNPVYDLGKTVQVRWATSLNYASLVLWQNDNAEYEWIQTNLSDTTSYDWIVSTNRDLKDGNVFFFEIRDATDPSNTSRKFGSHYFNITGDTSTMTTKPPAATFTTPTVSLSSTATSTSVSLTTSASEITPTSTPEGTPESSTADDEESGLSGEAKVAIGVGVGLGVPFIAILAAIAFFVRRKAAQNSAAKAGMLYPPPPAYMYPPQDGGYMVKRATPPLVEAPLPEPRRFELQG